VASSPPTDAYVFDATSLIYFERRKRLARLQGSGVRLYVPDRVAKEVDKPRYPLEKWLEANRGLVTRMLPEEGRLYLRFLAQPETRLHDGEAAALAIALHRTAKVVTDDEAARRKASSHGISFLTTKEFIAQVLPRQLAMLEP
jgi:predicted nucleic acid-binding protein